MASVAGAAGIDADDASRAGTGLPRVSKCRGPGQQVDTAAFRRQTSVFASDTSDTSVGMEHHRPLGEAAVRICLSIRPGTVDDRPPGSGEQQSGLEGLETDPGFRQMPIPTPIFWFLLQLPISCPLRNIQNSADLPPWIYPWLLSANGGLFFSLIWFRGSGFRGSGSGFKGSEVEGPQRF